MTWYWPLIGQSCLHWSRNRTVELRMIVAKYRSINHKHSIRSSNDPEPCCQLSRSKQIICCPLVIITLITIASGVGGPVSLHTSDTSWQILGLGQVMFVCHIIARVIFKIDNGFNHHHDCHQSVWIIASVFSTSVFYTSEFWSILVHHHDYHQSV